MVAAIFYTLIESAKLAGVEPKAYLRAATLAALEGTVIYRTNSRSRITEPFGRKLRAFEHLGLTAGSEDSRSKTRGAPYACML